MFKSKHSGWTFAGTRTPFGGGGDIFQSAGNTVSGWDPHVTEGVGDYLSENGWMIPLAMITAGAGAALGGGVVAGEVVGEGAIAGAGGATAADGTVFAAGSTIPAGTTMAEGSVIAAGETSAAGISGGGAFTPSAGSGASFVVDPSAAYTAGGATGGASAVTATPGADAVLNSPTQISNLTPPGAGNFGTITPPTAGAVTGAGGLTGGMGAGTMVGDGTLGTTIGQSYMSAGPGQFALNASGSAIPAGASGIAGTVPSSGLSASDVINNAKRAKNLSDALKQGASSGLSNSLGQLAQGANPQGQALGAAVRGNPNPFTFSPQQPIQDAKPLDLASLANLLKQG